MRLRITVLIVFCALTYCVHGSTEDPATVEAAETEETTSTPALDVKPEAIEIPKSDVASSEVKKKDDTIVADTLNKLLDLESQNNSSSESNEPKSSKNERSASLPPFYEKYVYVPTYGSSGYTSPCACYCRPPSPYPAPYSAPYAPSYAPSPPSYESAPPSYAPSPPTYASSPPSYAPPAPPSYESPPPSYASSNYDPYSKLPAYKYPVYPKLPAYLPKAEPEYPPPSAYARLADEDEEEEEEKLGDSKSDDSQLSSTYAEPASPSYAEPPSKPAYEAPAPKASYAPASYSAPSPPHTYTYPSPSPKTTCGQNLLVGCLPTLANAPCSAYNGYSAY